MHQHVVTNTKSSLVFARFSCCSLIVFANRSSAASQFPLLGIMPMQDKE